MAPSAFDLLRRIRRSNRAKYAFGACRRILILHRQKSNPGVFSVEIEATSGFFAIMQMILFILCYCEQNGTHPHITARGGIYGDESGKVDWFGSLFSVTQVPDAAVRRLVDNPGLLRTDRIRDISELGFRPRYESTLSLKKASDLFAKYYRPSQSILVDVSDLENQLNISSQTLGIHYRGTDKIHEAKSVTWEKVCQMVQTTAMHNSKLTNIFLASDEVTFVEYFRNYPFSLPVTIAPAEYLPKGNKPVHFSGHAGLAIGREALVTCLLLSRCGFLLKTPSYLSAWAKIFNPNLPVWLISPPNGSAFWFPDSALWRDQANGIFRVPAQRESIA